MRPDDWQHKAVAGIRRVSRVRGRLDSYRHTVRYAWSTPYGVDRLVASPVFLLCPPRSGSTLLRVLLNTHSQIRAPHEMHLRTLRVRIDRSYADLAVRRLGLDVPELEHLLWDRVMHRELQRSGKRILVDKTPGNGAVWERLAKAWPAARFIFLIRHPASVAQSIEEDKPDRPKETLYSYTRDLCRPIDAARSALPGLTVRYEDLAADAADVTQAVCRFLGVAWEPTMLEYGAHKDNSGFRVGIGDFGDKIRSGRVQPARPLPAASEIPAELRELAAAWGYLA